ncbi:MAG: non-canonical purine NTP diphosphatase [Bacteroidales bacterium]|nr:MAG: non-canonical purine NTP diphosphatase [Bacteroidales bacterium]
MLDKQIELVFATNNQHKLREVQELLGNHFKVLSLSEIGINVDIPEDFDTLQENALQKAQYIYNRTGHSCFADDTGLEVDALNGEPGVFSARYAGESKSSKDNIKKLLANLEGVKNRKARFRTVIALIFDKQEYLFEGEVWGTIIETEQGSDGFGYDPVFLPDGYDNTFAQMPLELKNRISHRGIAVSKLITFLKSR